MTHDGFQWRSLLRSYSQGQFPKGQLILRRLDARGAVKPATYRISCPAGLIDAGRLSGMHAPSGSPGAVAGIAVLCFCAAALAQEPPAHDFTMQAVKTATPPDIDGVLRTNEWQGAARVGDFLQYQPIRGNPAEFATTVFLLYDDTQLYVAFEAHDPDPLISQMTVRDGQLWNDDSVQLYIDSFHDGRSGYYFMTNVLGTQLDGRLSEDGNSDDQEWDAPWRSATERTDTGYTTEIAIPLSAIQYRAGNGTTWGINFGRSRRRSLERTYWAGPPDHWGRMSMAGDLTGLDVPPPSLRHQLIPYALSQLQEGQSPDAAAGFDFRYAATPQTSAYATLNPDFATIEADQEEVNLSRFELRLPEKRQFFLEGQEHFNQRIRTFYSRRIGDVIGGAKVLGKQGGWAFAALSTAGDLSLDPDIPEDSSRATYAVTRLQRDVASRSNIGFLFANRTFRGANQGSAGIDASLFFTETFGFTGQLVQSYGRHETGGLAFFARPSYDSATGHAHVRYTHLGERFADNVNAVGFIQDDDRRELDGAADKTWWPQSGLMERVQYGSNYNVYWAQTRILRSWQVDQGVTVDWRSKWTTTMDYTEEFKRFEKDFRNRQTALRLGYNTRAYKSVTGGLTFGRNFDADFRLWSAAGKWKVTDKLSAEYELQRLFLDPDPGDESTWIHVLRASQFFTPDLLVRVFFQTNSAIDRRNIQAVFVYRYLPPFGQIQLAYQRGTAEFGQRSDQGNTLFIKLTTVL